MMIKKKKKNDDLSGFKKIILFIYLWLHWVFFAARISLVVVSGG